MYGIMDTMSILSEWCFIFQLTFHKIIIVNKFMKYKQLVAAGCSHQPPGGHDPALNRRPPAKRGSLANPSGFRPRPPKHFHLTYPLLLG
jgi:hypothetical protein